MENDVDKIQLYLAEIASIYNRLVRVIPPDQWGSVSELPDKQRAIAGDKAFELSRRIDVVRDLLDESLLAAQIKITDTIQAQIFFTEIQPKRDAITDLWLAVIQMQIDWRSLAESDFDEQTQQEKPLWPDPYHVSDLASLFRWCVERVDDYLEIGGTSPDVIVENKVYDKALRLIEAKFFQPDKWYGNLQKLSPLVLNAKKLPRVVEMRVRELYNCLIVNTPSAAAILSRSTLEYVLLERAPSYSILSKESNGDLKKLGALVKEYSEKVPELEIDIRSVKRIGDQAVHAYVGHKNVVTISACGTADAFRSWASLRDVLQKVYG